MSDRCPIYAAQEITIRAAVESRRLLEAFEGKMASRGFMLGKAKTDRDSNEEHGGDAWNWVRSYPILKMGRRRRERTISLGFDLYRGASSRPSEWAHSSDALLIVAYGSYGLASRWTCAQIAVSDEGFPATCADGGSNVSPEDGQLVVYDGPKKKYWVNKDWLFAVPLRAIDSSAALEREVVKPLARLLLSNSLADAFEDTKAVTWPSLAPADDV